MVQEELPPLSERIGMCESWMILFINDIDMPNITANLVPSSLTQSWEWQPGDSSYILPTGPWIWWSCWLTSTSPVLHMWVDLLKKAYLATPVRISMCTFGLIIYRLPNDSVGSFVSLAMASLAIFFSGLSRILINWQGCTRKLGSFGLLGFKKHTSCALNSQLLREASSTPQGFWLYMYLRVHDTCHSVLVCLASIWQLAQDGGER